RRRAVPSLLPTCPPPPALSPLSHPSLFRSLVVAITSRLYWRYPVNKTPYLIAAALLAVTAGAAMAQDNAAPAAQGKPRVSLDANKDGVIDRQEAAARPRLAERFDELDRNKDGK